MDNLPDLENLEKETYSSFHNDGILEMLLGLWMIIFGIGLAYDMAFIGGVLAATGYPLWLVARKLITEPRLGLVNFGKQRQDIIKQGLSALLVLMIVSFVFNLSLYYLAASSPESKAWLKNHMPAIAPLYIIIILMMVLCARLFDVKKLYYYAAGSFFVLVLGAVFSLHDAVILSANGSFFAVIGVVTLFNFVKKYPVVGKEVD